MAVYLPQLGAGSIELSAFNENGEESAGEETTVLSAFDQNEDGSASVPPSVGAARPLGFWGTIIGRQEGECSVFSQRAGDPSFSPAARVRFFWLGWPSFLLRLLLAFGHAVMTGVMGMGEQRYGGIFICLLASSAYLLIFAVALGLSSVINPACAFGLGAASVGFFFSAVFLFCCHCRCRCPEEGDEERDEISLSGSDLSF